MDRCSNARPKADCTAFFGDDHQARGIHIKTMHNERGGVVLFNAIDQTVLKGTFPAGHR